MNKSLRNALVTVMFLVSLTGVAAAVDIAVCVTMPKIPGVNAPLIEEETRIPPEEYTNTQESQTAYAAANEAQKTQTPTLIQQESQLTTAFAQPLIVVRTLYEK